MAAVMRIATELLGVKSHNHQLLVVDSDGEEGVETDEEDEEDWAMAAPQAIRAQTAWPQDLRFVVPDDAKMEEPVCVQGPHGPLRVPLPEGAEPGKECSVRLGPASHYKVKVPEDVKPGAQVSFEGHGGQVLYAPVPEGAAPGDEFEVSMPVLLIRVPPGAVAGTPVAFQAPSGEDRVVRVPAGLSMGHYFPVLLSPPGTPEILPAETTPPCDLTFAAPAGSHPGEHVCVQGPHGPMMVALPENSREGEQCTVRLGPAGESLLKVEIPEGFQPGRVVTFKGPDGEELQAEVPEGKAPGDTFETLLPVVMVRVPIGAKPGSEVMFQTPTWEVRFARVPEGLGPGHYFPVLLSGSAAPAGTAGKAEPESESTNQ